MEDLLWAVRTLKNEEPRRVSLSSASASAADSWSDSEESQSTTTNTCAQVVRVKAATTKKTKTTPMTTIPMPATSMTTKVLEGSNTHRQFSCAKWFGAKLLVGQDDDDSSVASSTARPCKDRRRSVSGGGANVNHHSEQFLDEENALQRWIRTTRHASPTKARTEMEKMLFDSGGSPGYALEWEKLMLAKFQQEYEAHQPQTTCIDPTVAEPSAAAKNRHRPVPDEESILFPQKRIEVLWDMKGGDDSEWFAGTVDSVSTDGSEAVVLYDDGDESVITNGNHPKHLGQGTNWRCWFPSSSLLAKKQTVFTYWTLPVHHKNVNVFENNGSLKSNSHFVPRAVSAGKGDRNQNKPGDSSGPKKKLLLKPKPKPFDRTNILKASSSNKAKAIGTSIAVKVIKKSKKRVILDRASQENVFNNITTEKPADENTQARKKHKGAQTVEEFIAEYATLSLKEIGKRELESIRKRRPIWKKLPNYAARRRHEPRPIKWPPGVRRPSKQLV